MAAPRTLRGDATGSAITCPRLGATDGSTGVPFPSR